MVVAEVGTTECFSLCAEGEIKGQEPKGGASVTGKILNQVIKRASGRKIYHFLTSFLKLEIP